MRVNFKKKFFFSLIMIIFLAGFIFVNQAKGQEEKEEPQVVSQEISDKTRIIVSTSGPAKFNSYWLEKPPRLVVEFQSSNILTKIDKEIIVDQGVIKRITSSYYGRGRRKSLKSLTFELSKQVSYRIWQEGNSILLDIESPLETSIFLVGKEGISVEGRATDDAIIKRLEAMDTALTQVAETTSSLDTPNVEVKEEVLEEISTAEEEVAPPKTEVLPIVVPETLSTRKRPTIWGVAFWPAGLFLASGVGFLAWYRRRQNTQKTAEKLKKLKLELQEKDKQLKQEETIRHAIEKASLQKEKEYKKLESELQEKNDQLKKEETLCESIKKAALEKGKECKGIESVLQKQNKRLKEAEALRATAEKKVLEKEEEYTKLKDSYDTLEDTMIKKTAVKKMLTPEEKERLWINGKSEEKRASPRFSLSKDFNKTIVLRIETSPQTYIRSFVNNVSSGGLCFETEKEFEITKPINLRLFFYGDKVPMLKAQSQFIWKRRIGEIIYYGVCFELMDEKNKQELDRYIESNISEEAMVEV